MEFSGVVYKILAPTKGTSQRGDWHRQDVVFELPNEYSRKIAVTFFNKESEVAKLREGDSCTVSANVESREYNGKWYTDVKAWKIEVSAPHTEAAASPNAYPTDSPMPGDEPSYAKANVSEEVDDLPF